VSTDKPNKLKARLPRGLADRGPAEIAATRRMLETIRRVFERYGFEPVETPQIEYTDALGKFLPDQDRPNEGVFSFQDDDEQWLSLRYDLTAPLARYVAENFDALPKPYRSYRFGYVYRNEKPGPGRFRQFMQFDADTVGASSPAADAEMCMMMADTLERVGIRRGDYVVKVNNRKVLDGILDQVDLGGDENAGRRMMVLRAIDKRDRLGAKGVKALLGPGRIDDSGDRTPGALLRPSAVNRIMDYVDAWTELQSPKKAEAGRPMNDMDVGEGYFRDNYAIVRRLRSIVGSSTLGNDGLDELETIVSLVESSGYGSRRIQIDPSVVRGLEYYTGPVYEAELTFEVTNDDGQPVRFGSVGGGGRYDGLVGRFRDEPVPATGFSIGVSRLLAALKAVDSPIVTSAEKPGPVVVLVMDRDRIADYQAMTARLREAGVRAELYLGAAGLKAQMKYADRRQSPCAVIQGSNEKAEGKVQIKDLRLGAEIAQGGRDRADYLHKQAEAQFSVDEGELVEAVRRVLARYSA